ncbi:MAG: glucose-1-phosphate cytidylyltransferase [Candidatus Altiarchaeota archaeon]|nr:glucose-1-phosphate cytidylyltransferase [Candidatus Altiarchaeota archaeon]
MKVLILCGGAGTRLKEQTEFMPKPLVEIGGMPILWHIMKIYSHYGYKDFVLCLGYKGSMIKDYFMNFEWMANDFTLDLSSKKERTIHEPNNLEDWRVTFADTGLETNTGGRIKRVEKYVDGDTFLCTYGDGLADIDIGKLLAHHKKMGKAATLTAIHPTSRFGVIETKDGIVNSFKEKPRLDGLINGGFFVFNKKVFDYLDDDSVLEQEPLKNIAKDRQLSVFEHNGFWGCMDTFKDANDLNRLWESGNPPWRVWR